MTLLSTRHHAKPQARLTRDDWIETALSVLVDEGIEAIQVTQLARRLGVTRGSFYWHFKSREDLLEALLKEWRARNTGVMLSALSTSPSLVSGILDLFSVWVDHKQFDPRLDQAVRDWARRSKDVRAKVTSEDESRVRSIASFFESHGYAAVEAFIRARVIYFTQLSFYALGIEDPMTERMSYLPAYIKCFTGQDIDEAAAQEFQARLMAKT